MYRDTNPMTPTLAVAYENPRILDAISELGKASDNDILDLVLVCADQAGLDLHAQRKIEAIVQDHRQWLADRAGV